MLFPLCWVVGLTNYAFEIRNPSQQGAGKGREDDKFESGADEVAGHGSNVARWAIASEIMPARDILHLLQVLI